MGVSRSIGSLVVRIVADGLGAYKAEMNALADTTEKAASKIDKGAKVVDTATGAMGGGLGNAAEAATELHTAAGLAGVGLGVLAVGAAATAYAAYKGAQEQVGYQKALILTGNAAGTTSGQMADMARNIGDQAGTVHDASTALTAMAATGQVAGAMLEKSARVAAEEQRVLGTRVDDTAKRFADLGEDPVRASMKLNESMHYLTASTYAQIKAAQDLGDEDRAATLAQEAYADATLERLAAVQENLGYLETAWKGLRGVVLGTWDAMMGAGRETTVQQKIDALKQSVLDAKSSGSGADSTGTSLESLQTQLEYMQRIAAGQQSAAVRMADQAKREENSISLAERADKYASRQVQMQREIAAAKNQLTNSNQSAADFANYEQAVVGIANKFKEPEKAGHRARAPAKEVDEAAKGVALYNDLVAKSNGFTANYAEQMHSLALAASKGALSVDEVARAVAMINSQQPGAVALAKAEEDALAAAIKTIEKNDELARSYDDARVAAAEYLDTLRLQAEREAGGVGRGTAYREDQSGLNNIEDKFTTKKAKLLRDSDKKGEYWYAQELALAQSTYDQEVAIYQKSVADKRAAQGDWVNGANEAFANYLDSARNTANSVGDVFSTGLKGSEDYLTNLFTTSHASWDSLEQSIVQGITRIIVQQQMIKPVADYLQGGMSSGSGLGGLISSGLNAIFGGGSDPAGGANMTNLFADAIPRAGGGPVSASGLYRVNEKGPEVVSVSGKDYLMMGNQSGNVTPNNQISSGGGSRVQNNTVVNNFHLSGTVDKRTQSQMASNAGAAVQRALARSS
jgi:lambda family phage tail tape measure protein